MNIKNRENFLTLFKIGYFKKAPGTWGSFFGLIMGIPILYFSSFSLFIVAVFVGLIAIREIEIYEKEVNEHDSSHIVIDEVVGIWTALSIAQFNLSSIIFSFIFFRIYDIYKPSIIGKIDKEVEGGLGVVGDDFIAGIFAGISSLLLIVLFDFLGFDIRFK